MKPSHQKDIFSRWEKAKHKTYKAHVADVDGNLTSEDEVLECLSTDIIQRIKNRIIDGIPFGVSSARSLHKGNILESIRNDVLKGLSPQETLNFFLFPEQGTIAIWSDIDNNGNLIERKVDLVKFFKIVPETMQEIKDEERLSQFNHIENSLQKIFFSPVLKYKNSKQYGFLAKIIKDGNQTVTKATNEILAKDYPDYEAFCTRSSIFVAVKGANKELPLRFLAHLYNISIDEIVGTDDQGNKAGVGWHLTTHKAGFSTNLYDITNQNQIPLSIISEKKGKDAWLFLDDSLSYIAPSYRKI